MHYYGTPQILWIIFIDYKFINMNVKQNMNKILLVNPPWFRLFGKSSPWSPLGLCYIAGVLEKNGFDVSIYNADAGVWVGLPQPLEIQKNYNLYLEILNDVNHSFWKDIIDTIKEKSPEIVGISVKTATYHSALNISRLIKNHNPDIKVVWGGVHPTILPDEVIKNKEVDVVVRGEGEYSFLELVQNIDTLDKIKGITFRKNGNTIHNPDRPLIENLDEIPFPARHLIIGKEKAAPETFGNIFATRGCPYNCIFCTISKIWKTRVRYRSPRNVVDEIKQIKKDFRTHHFSFEDDSFTINEKFVKSLCNLIIQEKLKIGWRVETRVDLVADDLIRVMKSAGCEEIAIGVESGDEGTLRKIKKGITLDQVRKANAILKKNKIAFIDTFFMVGFPWETEKEIQNTISFMKELNPRRALFSIATPYVGTELYQICDNMGLIPQDRDWRKLFHQSPDLYFNPNFTKEEFKELIKKVEIIFNEHNLWSMRKLLLLHPIYVLKRIISGKYYHMNQLIGLFKQYIWK